MVRVFSSFSGVLFVYLTTGPRMSDLTGSHAMLKRGELKYCLFGRLKVSLWQCQRILPPPPTPQKMYTLLLYNQITKTMECGRSLEVAGSKEPLAVADLKGHTCIPTPLLMGRSYIVGIS